MTLDFSDLRDSLYAGFIDKDASSKERLQPTLVTNNQRQSACVLEEIIEELATCEEFFISAAFLTKSGVAVLMNSLIDARERQAGGKILVSEYLGFTQPEALRALKQFENVDLRVATKGNMHGKAYLFLRERHNSIIIGSSNLTANALKSNNEINLKVSATRNSAIYDQVLEHLHDDFSHSVPADDSYIDNYALRYEKSLAAYRKNLEEIQSDTEQEITPNRMQQEALIGFRRFEIAVKIELWSFRQPGQEKRFSLLLMSK